MSVCGARNFLLAVRFTKFRPRHSLRLAQSTTGSARLIVHFDISPSMLNSVLEYNDYSIFLNGEHRYVLFRCLKIYARLLQGWG